MLELFGAMDAAVSSGDGVRRSARRAITSRPSHIQSGSIVENTERSDDLVRECSGATTGLVVGGADGTSDAAAATDALDHASAVAAARRARAQSIGRNNASFHRTMQLTGAARVSAVKSYKAKADVKEPSEPPVLSVEQLKELSQNHIHVVRVFSKEQAQQVMVQTQQELLQAGYVQGKISDHPSWLHGDSNAKRAKVAQAGKRMQQPLTMGMALQNKLMEACAGLFT